MFYSLNLRERAAAAVMFTVVIVLGWELTKSLFHYLQTHIHIVWR